MQINDILNIALPIVLIVVGIALVVFIIELIKIVKVARVTLTDTKTHLDPMMANFEEMTESIKPAVAKVDPLVDRVQLLVDAVNLEMMRVDEILEDVSQISDSASSAAGAVDSITNAPLKAVTNVTSRVRTALNPKSSSAESAQIAEHAEQRASEAPASETPAAAKHNDSVARALADFYAAEAEDAEQDAIEAAKKGQVVEAPALDPEAPKAEEVVDAVSDETKSAFAELESLAAKSSGAVEGAANDDSLDKQPTGPIPVDEVNARLNEQAANAGGEA